MRGLPAEHQAILEYAAEAANTANYGLAMDIYSADLQTLINDDGVNVYRTDSFDHGRRSWNPGTRCWKASFRTSSSPRSSTARKPGPSAWRSTT